MKRMIALLVSAVMCLCSCSAVFDTLNEETATEITETAVFGDYTLTLGEGEVKYSDIYDKNFLIVHAVFTNAGEPEYAYACFAVRAFQNDVSLDLYDGTICDIDTNLTTEIRNGASLDVAYCFPIEDMSEVEVIVGSPTADRKTIGKRVYKLS